MARCTITSRSADPRFICSAGGKRGAEVWLDFSWNKKPLAMMGYR
jgi:hypothetical protein